MILAAIDIGSHSTKLKISEYKNDKFIVLDELTHPLNLGNLVLRRGYIDNDGRESILNILKYFKKIMSEYGVEKYLAYATGVFRAASNGQVVIDLIGRKTGLKIEIVEETIERYISYLPLVDILSDYEKMRREGMLVVEVGSSSSEVIVYKNNKMVRSNEIEIGTLSLKSLNQAIKKESKNVADILSDYIYAATENLQAYLVRKKILYFVMMGTEIKKIHKIYGDYPDGFSLGRLEELYQRLSIGDRELRRELELEMLDWDEALISITIYRQFCQHTEAELIKVPDVSLRDGILRALVNNTFSYDRKLICTNDIVKAAKQLAKRYHSTSSHINQIDKNVIKIFDAYKKVENYTEKDLLLLRLAACLHETGKFSRQDNYTHATQMAIINASLLGVTADMLKDVAQIVEYFFLINKNDISNLSGNVDLKLLRLALILAIGDAMDKSKRSRLMIESVKLSEHKLRIKVLSQSNYYLERAALTALNNLSMDLYDKKIVIEE